MANPNSSSPPPRRITRSSLARFAYVDEKAPLSTSAATPDIEDVIPNTASAASRKRKRASTTTTTKIKTTITTSASPPARKPKIKAEEEEEEEERALEDKPPLPAPKRPPRRPARKTIDPATGAATVAPPSDWEAVYAAVRRMRAPGGAAYPAPVDTMGCERLADPRASARDQRFQTLVALMLSSQTKDAATAAAVRNLQTSLPPASSSSSPHVAAPGLTLENVLAASPAQLNALIRGVGFHNNKTAYVQRAAAALRDAHGGDVPDTLAGLVALPGVGPKMAHLCLSAAWGRTEGIGVDVHVHRITNLWRWHGGGTATTRSPEHTRAALEAWLPRDRWREINALLVGLGQTVCLPVAGARRCGDCEVGLLGLCPAADRAKVLEGRKARKTEVDGFVKAEIEVGEDDGKGDDKVGVKVEVEERGAEFKVVEVKKEEEE
ncbi:DNA glycosylase [Biscogniauxia mediterranea]|nr:DNA glycosylase [Biscogniauxia mediterranea]